MKEWKIDEIEALTYEEVKELAEEKMEIKEHECFFADFGGYFGYSVLVYKNGYHIYYANDYQLHHPNKEKDELRKWYIEGLNGKLFTDDELMGNIKTYAEYQNKMYFLWNLWFQHFDSLSIYNTDKKDKLDEYPYFSKIGFKYVKELRIIEQAEQYDRILSEEFEKMKDNLKAFREMVAYELANHEACITCDYEDGLSALGLTYEELSEEKRKIVLEELRKQIDYYLKEE